MKGVVFAAGYGRRLHPLTTTRPKHLLPVAGRPLLLRVIEAMRGVGVREIAVTVGYMADKVTAILSKIGVETIHQKLLMGTGQALRESSPFLKGEDRFYVVYGDVTAPAERLRLLQDFCLDGGFDGAMLAVRGGSSGAYGVVKVRESMLESIAEKSGEAGLINTGIYILPSAALDVVETLPISPRGEYELTDALNILVRRGYRIGVLADEGMWWFDVGRPLDYLNANLYYTQAEVGDAIVAGPNVVLGHNVRLCGPLILGGGSHVGSGTTLVGPAVIGEGCQIAPDSYIAKSVLMERVRMISSCRLVCSILSDETEIYAPVKVDDDIIPGLVTAPRTQVSQSITVGSTLVI